MNYANLKRFKELTGRVEKKTLRPLDVSSLVLLVTLADLQIKRLGPGSGMLPTERRRMLQLMTALFEADLLPAARADFAGLLKKAAKTLGSEGMDPEPARIEGKEPTK